MTSAQAMLIAALLAAVSCHLVGCTTLRRDPAANALHSPYPSRRLWAVAPLRNESGSLHADGLRLADLLAQQLETASNLDVLPVNRTLAAMESLRVAQLTSRQDVMRLLQALGADGIVVGTITAYDPYDPPKLGIAIELYTTQAIEHLDHLALRRLAAAATDEGAQLPRSDLTNQPVAIVSAFLDAGDPATRLKLQRFAESRGPVDKVAQEWHRYRISMDLYSEFVSYVTSWRLLDAERRRMTPPTVASSSKDTNPSAP